MKLNTFNVRFIIRNDRLDTEGYAPIYSKITINGKRLSIALNYKIKPNSWVVKTESVKSNSKNSKLINDAIEAMKSGIYQAHSHILATNKPLNVSQLRAYIFGEDVAEKRPTLLEVIQQHNEHFEKMIGIKYSKGSFKNYKTSQRFLMEFIPTYNHKKDIALKDVNYKFAEAFFTFLTTIKTCKQNGANKQIQRLKTIINYAIKQGYLEKNPLSTFSLEFSPVNKIALTVEELVRLSAIPLHRVVLQQVREVFLFQCYTGLSYADVKQLSMKHLHRLSEQEYCIKMNREKTKVAFTVPLLPQAMSILLNYIRVASTNKPILPVISNQKMNEHLKLLQELGGIPKNLTTHLARHTFATTITLSNGVPIETVSRMLGHTKLVTTQLYAKVLDDKIAKDMHHLRLKLEEQ
jgi:site-specific recombinase XerD